MAVCRRNVLDKVGFSLPNDIMMMLITVYNIYRLGQHHHESLEKEGDPSLQLVGIYGLVSCLSVLVSGSAIGRMVDNTARNR